MSLQVFSVYNECSVKSFIITYPIVWEIFSLGFGRNMSLFCVMRRYHLSLDEYLARREAAMASEQQERMGGASNKVGEASNKVGGARDKVGGDLQNASGLFKR